jgi:hypothetical protein
MTSRRSPILTTLALATLASSSANAQRLHGLIAGSRMNESAVICGIDVFRPRLLPPANSGPVIYLIAPCFQEQGGRSREEPANYLRDIQLRPSQPSVNRWVPFDAAAERQIFDDYQRLWSNHALDSLSIEIRDYRFANGVVGKLVTYNIRERN